MERRGIRSADVKVDIPADLRISTSEGRLYLASNGREVSIDYRGIFRDGSVAWSDLWFRFVVPALAQFKADGK